MDEAGLVQFLQGGGQRKADLDALLHGQAALLLQVVAERARAVEIRMTNVEGTRNSSAPSSSFGFGRV